MSCDCKQVCAKTEAERKTLRVALSLNAAMFVIGTVAGLLAQSTGLLADALDMLTDAVAYGLALMAISRGLAFKKIAAIGLYVLKEAVEILREAKEDKSAEIGKSSA